MKGSTGVIGPDGKTMKLDTDFNLGVNESIRSLIDEQCTRIIYLKKYGADIKKQSEKEVGELQQIAAGLAEENTRLKILLKRNGIEYR